MWNKGIFHYYATELLTYLRKKEKKKEERERKKINTVYIYIYIYNHVYLSS